MSDESSSPSPSNANLLLLFPTSDRKFVFSDRYLDREPDFSLKGVVRLVMMEFAITLGSQFWHDIAKGFIDIRSKARAVREESTQATQDVEQSMSLTSEPVQ